MKQFRGTFKNNKLQSESTGTYFSGQFDGKIIFADQSFCLVTFEKGLDFVRLRWGTDEYEVTEKSKVFVEPM